jgi:hypothetical protein
MSYVVLIASLNVKDKAAYEISYYKERCSEELNSALTFEARRWKEGSLQEDLVV